MRKQVDEAAATSGDGETSEVIGEIASDGDGADAPRGEAAAGSAANKGSSAMAAASSGGEVNELIDEVARSEENERGDAAVPKKRGVVRKGRNQRRREQRKE